MTAPLQESALNTIFAPCRQCGSCCRQFRKITLQADEVDFITRMGGHVGVDVSFSEIREKGLARAREDAVARGKIFMIHPDDKGCIFLMKKNDTSCCRIYHYRPRSCRGFRCNLADDSMLSLLGNGAHLLLGQDAFGLPLKD